MHVGAKLVLITNRKSHESARTDTSDVVDVYAYTVDTTTVKIQNEGIKFGIQ